MAIQYAAGKEGGLRCPVCGNGLDIRLAHGRRSGKSFLMVVCPRDGRHFRGFINDAGYVREVLARLETAGSVKAEERTEAGGQGRGRG